MTDHITTEQMQKIAEEVAEYDSKRPNAVMWRIASIEHFYEFPFECYGVRYYGGFMSIFVRSEFTAKLGLASTWTYWAEDNFADTHKHEPDEESQVSA